MDNGATEKLHEKRIKYLQAQNSDLTIDVIKIDKVTEDALSGELLV